MKLSNIKPIPAEHQGKVAVALVAGIALLLGIIVIAGGSSSSPTPTAAPRPAPAVVEVSLSDDEVREHLATAFRGIDAEGQDATCAGWRLAGPAERFTLYKKIVGDVRGISDAQIDTVFGDYFASVCS